MGRWFRGIPCGTSACLTHTAVRYYTTPPRSWTSRLSSHSRPKQRRHRRSVKRARGTGNLRHCTDRAAGAHLPRQESSREVLVKSARESRAPGLGRSTGERKGRPSVSLSRLRKYLDAEWQGRVASACQRAPPHGYRMSTPLPRSVAAGYGAHHPQSLGIVLRNASLWIYPVAPCLLRGSWGDRR